jgi:hypothetical protein
MRYLIIFVLLSFSSCHSKEGKHTEPREESNWNETLSQDSARLSRLINLSEFKPLKVQYRYVFIDNSGSQSRLSVPGPSDSHLEAILEFDSATIERLRKAYYNIDYPEPKFSKKEFAFNWLDPQTLEELEKSDSTYSGHPDAFFSNRTSGKLWLLKHKVLLHFHTD